MPPYFKSRLLHKCKSTKSIIEDVSNSYKVYKNQIYSTGLSRSGHGTWELASRIPDTFAAIAPITGDSHGTTSYNTLTELPILIAHNNKGQNVAYQSTVKSINKIEELTSKKFKVFNTIDKIDNRNSLILLADEIKDHNTWTAAYSNVNFYKRLLPFEINNT